MSASPIVSVVSAANSAIDRLTAKSIVVSGRRAPQSRDSKLLTEGEAKQLKRLVQKHKQDLESLRRISKLRNRAKLAAAQDRYFSSYSARVCAVVRALARRGRYASDAEIAMLANALSVREPLTEKVRARIKPKPKGGWRVIVSHGLMRTAQQLVVRDLLVAMGIDSEFDYTRKNAGGEKAFINMICHHIDEGYKWWFVADVKEFFSSLRPGHFDWLPIPGYILRNVIFLAKCTKIEIVMGEGTDGTPTPLDTTHIESSFKGSLIRLIRQGLPPGAVCSPLLARSLVGRELRELLGEGEVVGGSFMDDLAIGACSRTDVKVASDALVKRLKSLPAGSLELHMSKPVPATLGIMVLGYKLVPGNGFCADPGKAKPVHVKPGRPRTDRFKRRLEDKLKLSAPGANLHEIGDSYWESWFNSQQAWTKVPNYSKCLSRNITASYVDDFKLGIPMGSNWTASEAAPNQS